MGSLRISYILVGLIMMSIIVTGCKNDNEVETTKAEDVLTRSYNLRGETIEFDGIVLSDGRVSYSSLYQLDVEDKDVCAVKVEVVLRYNRVSDEISDYEVTVEPIGARLISKSIELNADGDRVGGVLTLGAKENEVFYGYMDESYYEDFISLPSITDVKEMDSKTYLDDGKLKYIEFKAKEEWQGYYCFTLVVNSFEDHRIEFSID